MLDLSVGLASSRRAQQVKAHEDCEAQMSPQTKTGTECGGVWHGKRVCWARKPGESWRVSRLYPLR